MKKAFFTGYAYEEFSVYGSVEESSVTGIYQYNLTDVLLLETFMTKWVICSHSGYDMRILSRVFVTIGGFWVG
jgi:hypothetical protein